MIVQVHIQLLQNFLHYSEQCNFCLIVIVCWGAKCLLLKLFSVSSPIQASFTGVHSGLPGLTLAVQSTFTHSALVCTERNVLL